MPVPAHTPTDPNVLTNGAHCYRQCIPKGLQGAVIIWLLDQWLKKKEPEPSNCPPIVPIHWEPETVNVQWQDSGGNHIGNYATFISTANVPTTSSFKVLADITSIVGLQSLPALSSFTYTGGLGEIQIDCSCCQNLGLIDIRNNEVTSLLAEYCPNLSDCFCDDNLLTTLKLTGSVNVNHISCPSNLLTSLEFIGFGLLSSLDCSNNQLGTLNITGCFFISTLDISNNPAVVIIGP